MKAWLFTLGTEVVTGRVVNTNAAYLGRRLTLLGFEVLGNVSLVDDVELIASWLSLVLSGRPALVVTTGGLGPTYDDVTLEAVARAAGRRLVLNEHALEMVRRRYEERGLPLTPERVKMAYLPEGGEAIPNPVGTAPGCWLRHGETIVVSLPGVPSELEAMWEGYVEPRLRKVAPLRHIAERLFTVVGVPESSAAAVVKRLLHRYPSIYVKTHPKGHETRGPVLLVYVQASASSREEAENAADIAAKELAAELENLGGSVTWGGSLQ
ncbi:MAG: nicotinamide mononucleotide deamidase-related protein [Thermofilum sp.]|nr:nicotinamide mononucleotide deamidase-related protein [Thermofilum sp.]